jgi:hypothetical protein
MAVLLFSVGTVALVAGLVMVGFGIPINEFSFGNTLISAGTTAAVGGLIIIALGVTVGQLRRIAESLASPLPKFEQAMDVTDAAAMSALAVGADRPSFPSRPRPEKAPAGSPPWLGEPASAASEDDRDTFEPPRLRNPEEPSVAVDDEVSLSPSQPGGSASAGSHPFADRSRPSAPPPVGGPEKDFADKGQESWRPSAPPFPPSGSSQRPIQPAKFDAMWPAEPKSQKNNSADEAKQAAAPARDQPAAIAQKRAESDTPKPRAVAILKSGVVDGMGYTLYVDGSIEAELPQGTLRFASINELRSHLEKNS